MIDAISGFWVALATPVAADGSVDHAALVRHAKRLLVQGCDGFVLFGTTGEGPSFSARERLDAVSAVLAAGIEPARLALGTGFPSITDSIALTRDALALGLWRVLILPPYFYRDVSAVGLEAAFAAILDGVNDERVRATLYHIPQVSGVAIPPATLAGLRRRYGKLVAGLKDSSADFAQFRAFRAAAPEAAIVVGNETDIARAIAEGGTGTICGMGNVVPALVRAMFVDPKAEIAMAEAVSLMRGPFIPLLKSVIAAMTAEAGWLRLRPPLEPVLSAQGEAIAARLRALITPGGATD
jgi:4-hydroxy-tetrahydrodipicolinate synthase